MGARVISVEPEFSRKAVTKAGRVLAQYGLRASPDELDEYSHAMEVLANWRASHSYPINTFQATLRSKIKRITNQPVIVAQRLKRTPSIIQKLRRNPGMELARMQDIGGLRAVMPTVGHARELYSSYRQHEHRFQHEFGSFKDYIEEPKDDGYRSIHQVFKYRNKHTPQFDGLQIEVQFRTRLQHSWATAVETLSTFLKQGLKTGGGDAEYRTYLKLCSAAFAQKEKCPAVPGYEGWSMSRIATELLELEEELELIPKLQGFSVAAKNIDVSGNSNAAFNLVVLNIDERRVRVRSFSWAQLDEATEAYTAAERRVQTGENLEVVLVSAGPIKSLKKAYPNYFLDTASFVQTVEKIIYDR